MRVHVCIGLYIGGRGGLLRVIGRLSGTGGVRFGQVGPSVKCERVLCHVLSVAALSRDHWYYL